MSQPVLVPRPPVKHVVVCLPGPRPGPIEKEERA